MSEQQLMDGLHTNWSAWLAATARHVDGAETRQFGTVAATSVGAPMPLFNQAFVFGEPVLDDIEPAAAWLRERGAPFWVTTPGHLASRMADHVGRLGLTSDVDTMPGMVLRSLDGLEPDVPADLDLVPVTRPDQLDIVAAATADGFGAPIEFARHMAPPSMLDDDSLQWFVGSIGGEPAACGQLLMTDDTAGVYSIAVIERFRRRGVGAAVTRAVLLAGRERGATHGVLQSSVMGRSVYAAMGFETFTEYALHVGSG